jgi:hypothetical protein
VLLSVAAGALFAVGAATIKLAAATFTTAGFAGLLTSWPVYLLTVVSLASLSVQQVAYASGSLASAVTAVVITDPMVSYLLGVVGFGEPVPALGGPLLLAVSGMAVLGVGVALLAHSPLLHPRRPRPEEEPRPAPVPASCSAPPSRASVPVACASMP